jgi:single-strand DNA-binding protein
MQANNNATLIGNVGGDPETRTFNDRLTASFSLAVERPGRKDGNKETDWFKVKIWGKQAELAADLIRKGTKLAVVGAIHIETWTGKEGEKQTSVVCQADGFQLLSPKQDGGQQHQPAPAAPPLPPMPPAPAQHLNPDDIPPF